MSRQKIYKTGIFEKGKKNPRRRGDWREERGRSGLVVKNKKDAPDYHQQRMEKQYNHRIYDKTATI